LVGVGHEDAEADAEQLATKIVGLRIFRDADGKTNEDLAAVGGEALVVSQFTLFADTRKGRRPSFLGAAEPGRAAELVEHLAARLEAAGVKVGRGVFGAEMAVELLNDGPFTVLFDTHLP
jgi:D-tyrosyl-tRNA(Tyr) deacylase